MIRAHEGDESAEIAAHWLRRQPQAFQVHRSPTGVVLGIVVALEVQDVTTEDLACDPAVRHALAYTRSHAPLRLGEQIQYVRFHMHTALYQQLSPNINVLATTVSLAPIRQPRVALTFLHFADIGHWAPMMHYLDFTPAEAASFSVGGRSYGVFVHDWRVVPPDDWADLVVERSLGTEPELPQTVARPGPDPLVVLSEPDFGAAVRRALRDFANPSALAANPLMRSRLVVEAVREDASPATLQQLIRQAAESLRSAPRSEKFYRAVEHTYLRPAPSQERAAEQLRLAFSTYRYHLARGTDAVIASLWERELNGSNNR
jgi:hypothetical protein